MSGQSNGTREENDCALPQAIRGIRIQEALARFAGDQQRYRHWLTEFIDHGPAAASQLGAPGARAARKP